MVNIFVSSRSIIWVRQPVFPSHLQLRDPEPEPSPQAQRIAASSGHIVGRHSSYMPNDSWSLFKITRVMRFDGNSKDSKTGFYTIVV